MNSCLVAAVVPPCQRLIDPTSPNCLCRWLMWLAVARSQVHFSSNLVVGRVVREEWIRRSNASTRIRAFVISRVQYRRYKRAAQYLLSLRYVFMVATRVERHCFWSLIPCACYDFVQDDCAFVCSEPPAHQETSCH